jgi:hypothetical protein
VLRRAGGTWNGNEQTPSEITMEAHLCAYLGYNMEKWGLNMNDSSMLRVEKNHVVKGRCMQNTIEH